jgi:DNA-binding transcriptional regulator YbjK
MNSKTEQKVKIILSATLNVIRKKGINRCNHRAVAEEAGVSLGLTTHYFKDLDSLLAAAMESYLTEFKENITNWFEGKKHLQPEDMLTEFMLDTLSDKFLLNYEYEMYAAAISRKALRPYSLKWLDITEDCILKFTGCNLLASKLITSLMDSIFIRSVIEQDKILLNRNEIFSAISAMLNLAPLTSD